MGTVKRRGLLAGSRTVTILTWLVLEEAVVGSVVDIDADGHDDNALVFQTLLHLDKRWGFFDTGWTQWPEIQHHDLTAKLAESDLRLCPAG